MGCFAEDKYVTNLVFDFYGNYTLQDLVETAKRFRVAALALVKSGRLSQAQADTVGGVVNGRDYLGMLVLLTEAQDALNNPSSMLDTSP